jgi:hypothetical protein
VLQPDSMYVVIPCTFDPNWESKFALTILTDNPIKIKKLQEVKDLTLEVPSLRSLGRSLHYSPPPIKHK